MVAPWYNSTPSSESQDCKKHQEAAFASFVSFVARDVGFREYFSWCCSWACAKPRGVWLGKTFSRLLEPVESGDGHHSSSHDALKRRWVWQWSCGGSWLSDRLSCCYVEMEWLPCQYRFFLGVRLHAFVPHSGCQHPSAVQVLCKLPHFRVMSSKSPAFIASLCPYSWDMFRWCRSIRTPQSWPWSILAGPALSLTHFATGYWYDLICFIMFYLSIYFSCLLI